jgi:FlaG/FlaF family flagellin (archaellin)
MRRPRGDSDAVSPVVGVMLMLAVTVMLAAVVSTYAGGFSDGAEKTPQSSIRVTPHLNEHRIYFEHDGGDPFLLSSIHVILRSGDNQTSLSSSDAGGSRLKSFEEVGDHGSGTNDTTLMAGDTFYLEGEGADSNTGLKFGNMVLRNNTKITWLVIDRDTSKTISMGAFYL